MLKFAIDEDPKLPFCSTALQHLVPKSIHRTRAVLSQVQNPALALDKVFKKYFKKPDSSEARKGTEFSVLLILEHRV